MKIAACFLLLLVGCGSSYGEVDSVDSQFPLPTFPKPIASASASAPVPMPKAIVDLKPKEYVACVNKVVKDSEYPRLQARGCIDSDGVFNLHDYWDSGLSLGCTWRTASDLSQRCLPKNESYSFQFSDENCKHLIALAQVTIEGDAVMPYAGVDAYDDVNQWIDIYHLGIAWKGETVSILAHDPGGDVCDTYSIDAFPGTGYFKVLGKVSPNLFVKKND